MMAMTYYDKLMGKDEDERSVEDLCRPLSAKVMPRSAMIGLSHEITEAQAIGIQRQTKRTVKVSVFSGSKKP